MLRLSLPEDDLTSTIGNINPLKTSIMKKATIILALVAILFTGCKSSQASLDSRRAEISWSAFCAARGYDLNDNTYPAINEYLDTWCGSVDEEAAFIKAGVEPY